MAQPRPLPFDWADPFALDAQLSDEERMVRDTAEAYAQAKLQPRVTSAYLEERFDREIMTELGALGMLGATIDPRIWRRRAQLCELRPDRARGGAGRQRLSLGHVGPVLARHAPDQRLRHRGAEAEISAEARDRRMGRLLRPHRARRRLRSRRRCAPARRRSTAATGSPAPRCGSPTRRSPTSSWSGPSPTRMRGGSRASSSRRA